MGKTERKLNMIQAAQDGIEAAKKELAGTVGRERLIVDKLLNDFPWDDDDDRAMTVRRAAYLACYFIAWKEAGSPPLN